MVVVHQSAVMETTFGGVVEGFYGRPWTHEQREILLSQMKAWGLSYYMYAPKDDVKHRSLWRELYTPEELGPLKDLIKLCARNEVNFIYAIGPGLDVQYSSEDDRSALVSKLDQVREAGCAHFALLFDDIAESLSSEDEKHYKSFAEAQCHMVNEVVEKVKHRTGPGSLFLFCPTPYCGTMALNDAPSLKENEYLRTVGQKMSKDIAVFWTGPNIVSFEISYDHIRELREVLNGKHIVIWDNLHANDYDVARVYLGPYSGRPVSLKQEVLGILSNPNCEFEVNFVPLRTLGMFLESETYEPEDAFAVALKEWRQVFTPPGAPAVYTVPSEHQIRLLCEVLYLPQKHGAQGRLLLSLFSFLVSHRNEHGSAEWAASRERFDELASRVVSMFADMTKMHNRDLLYSLYGYVWDLKEECLLMKDHVAHMGQGKGDSVPHYFEDFRPKSYRGGLVSDLRALLRMSPDGSFSPAPSATFIIRPFRADSEDLKAMYSVCLETGNSGADGTHLFPTDPDALGHRYVGPYAKLQPDLAFVLEDTYGVCGYVLGALNSESFYKQFKEDWLPHVHSLYPSLEPPEGDKSEWRPVDHVYQEFFEPSLTYPEQFHPYPSHLHIDIIQRAQRQGLGTKLMQTLLDTLRQRGSKGVHLGMSPDNHSAYKFYMKMGFKELERTDEDIFLCKSLV